MSILISFIIIIFTMVSMVACGNKDSEESESDSEKIVMGFSQVGAESEWRTANTKSIKESANEADIELKFSDGQQKQENQIKAIRSFIVQKVDIIAFSPIVETGWDTVLNEAKDANIPVILTDRAVDADETLYISFIGSDFVEEGRRAASWLIENSESLGLEGDIGIAELQGTTGSAPALDRKEGFEEVISEYPEYKIIKSQTGEFDRANAKEIMESFLKSDQDNIDVLFAHNDDMAIGAIQAIEDAGLKPGEDIIIVSIDGVKGAFEAMVEGKLNCTVECNPLLGPQLMEAVEKVVNGEEVEKRIVTQEGVFPAEVAEELLPDREY
jgi:simple sugar transport system substrate-binding protein